LNVVRYASPVDVATYGEYRIVRSPGDARPLYRFAGRITADGSSGFRAEPGRFHIYAGWFCPWAQRTTIQRALNGLEEVVSVSYVDNARDGRGWAFREAKGPDPVNGFALLREAYEATEPGFDGHISVPTLWDRETGRIVSNDFRLIGIDLATQFGAWSNGADTYPEQLREQIEELDSLTSPPDLPAALPDLNERVGRSRYLLGEQLTEADVRLWVHLIRYTRGLAGYPCLEEYVNDLYEHPAFQQTTDFGSFPRPVTA
jgi:putative glutathione S-transferase